MRTIESIEAEIAGLEVQIGPLANRLQKLGAELRDCKSKQFISVNGITRDEVEMSSGDGKPYFGSVWGFTDWMRRKPNKKRWAEWNGRIYHTSDLLNGVMPDDMPGLVDDLPK